MFKIKYIIITTWVLSVYYSDSEVEYIDYFVKLGDRWSVDCYTPLDKMAEWYFLSTDLKYDYYLFKQGKFVDGSNGRKYDITTSNDGHTYTLTVNQTTKEHSGSYACFPDATTLDGRQYYKLILTEYTNIQLFLNINKSATLNMNISYMGHETTTPTFKCTFPYGERVMDERWCNVIKHDYSSCGLKKLFEPDDVAPLRCGIYFKDKLWEAEELVINPETEIIFIRKETSWNMSCNTASSYPMKWIFQSFMIPNTSVVLYSKWIPNKDFPNRYHFNISSDKGMYNMKIPRVDLNHSGTYMCTHKSTDHLVEKRVDLLVIDESSIQVSYEPITLIMLISYMGNNKSMPSFVCDLNNQMMTMDHMVCKITKSKFTRCQLVETYDDNWKFPHKCYIRFGNFSLMESLLQVDSKNISGTTNTLTAILGTLAIIFFLILIIVAGFFIVTGKNYSHPIPIHLISPLTHKINSEWETDLSEKNSYNKNQPKNKLNLNEQINNKGIKPADEKDTPVRKSKFINPFHKMFQNKNQDLNIYHMDGGEIIDTLNKSCKKKYKMNETNLLQFENLQVVEQCIDNLVPYLSYENCAELYQKFIKSNNDHKIKITSYIVSNFYELIKGNHLDTLDAADIVTFSSDDNLTYIQNNVAELSSSDQEYKLFETIKNYLNKKEKYNKWPDFLTKSIRLGFLNNDQLERLIKDQSWLGTCKHKTKVLNYLNQIRTNTNSGKENSKFDYTIWKKSRNFSKGFRYDWSKMVVADNLFFKFNVNHIRLSVSLEQKRQNSEFVIVKEIKLWCTSKDTNKWISGIEFSYNDGVKYFMGNQQFIEYQKPSEEIKLREDEYINKIDYEGSELLSSLTFHTNQSRIFGPY